MLRTKRKNNSTTLIIEAALEVAIHKGAAKVSLDSVAKQAGLTKGRVLYNFPSKKALISGILDKLLSTYTPKVADYAQEYADKPNPTLKALVHLVRKLEEVNPNIFQAILTTAVHKQEILQPWQEEKQKRYAIIRQEAADADLASIYWLASEGLLLLDMLGILPFPKKEKARLLKVLEDKTCDV